MIKFFSYHLNISELVPDPQNCPTLNLASIQPSLGIEKSEEHHENVKTQYLSLPSFSTIILNWKPGI